MKGVGPFPSPSNSLQAPVNWEGEPVWGCPTVPQLHPPLLPPGSILGTFNQAVFTPGPSETLQILCQALGRCRSLYAWSLASLVSPQPDVTQPCFGCTGCLLPWWGHPATCPCPPPSLLSPCGTV